jgi:hypothetical protein
VIERLQNQHSLVILVTNSLTSYMDKVREIAKGRVFFILCFPLYFYKKKVTRESSKIPC